MRLPDEARQLFGSASRPDHFTNYNHCSECAEHDQTLRSADPDTLSYERVPPGWDPFCFINVEGFKYYFPALVRLAVEGSGNTYFIDQFLFHLESDGPGNARYRAFTQEQRAFVVRVLEYFVEERADEVEANLDADKLLRTLAVWSGSVSGQGHR